MASADRRGLIFLCHFMLNLINSIDILARICYNIDKLKGKSKTREAKTMTNSAKLNLINNLHEMAKSLHMDEVAERLLARYFELTCEMLLGNE